MTVPEFHAWVEFYRREPFDDYHRIFRPAALISQSLAGGDMDQKLAWLEKRPMPNFSAADQSILAAFGAKPPMRK